MSDTTVFRGALRGSALTFLSFRIPYLPAKPAMRMVYLNLLPNDCQVVFTGYEL